MRFESAMLIAPTMNIIQSTLYEYFTSFISYRSLPSLVLAQNSG